MVSSTEPDATHCPAGLQLCGVPCGCGGSNPSHRGIAEMFDAKYRRCEEHNRARYWCGCYYRQDITT